MISICCCTLNSKWETQIFVEGLHCHNPDIEFEIIITHDDRVEDGSAEFLQELSKKYQNVKVLYHSPEETIAYFETALNYYDRRKFFTKEIRKGFRQNFEAYKEGTLVDPTKGFLWQSSGILYNKAVQASSGDILIVTPGDFFYLFSLSKLQKHVYDKQQNGYYYASLPALKAQITNKPLWYIKEKLEQIRSQEIEYHKAHFNRDYLRCPPSLDKMYLPDPFTGSITSLDNSAFIRSSMNLARTAFSDENPWPNPVMRRNPQYHGFHAMTRKTYKAIGGFTEEWVHRAYADDKMTYHGKRIGPGQLPPQFSVSVDRPFEIVPCGDPLYPSDWYSLVKGIDPLFDRHPIPSGEKRTYLYDKIVKTKEMTQMVLRDMPVINRPIRFY